MANGLSPTLILVLRMKWMDYVWVTNPAVSSVRYYGEGHLPRLPLTFFPRKHSPIFGKNRQVSLSGSFLQDKCHKYYPAAAFVACLIAVVELRVPA